MSLAPGKFHKRNKNDMSFGSSFPQTKNQRKAL